MFTVSEGQLAIKSTGGEIVDSDFAPGLHFRIPLVNEVTKFDERIITQLYQAGAFPDPRAGAAHHRFLRQMAHQQSAPVLRVDGRQRGCRERAPAARPSGTASRRVVTQRTLQQVVTAERAEFTDAMMKTARPFAEQLGIELVDVRITKIDLPQQVQDSVFDRMRATFKAQAAKLRAEGVEASDRIRAEANKEQTEILADASRQAEPDSRPGRCVGERGLREVVLEECGVLQLLPQHAVLSRGGGHAGRSCW